MTNPMKMPKLIALIVFSGCLFYSNTFAQTAPNTITFDNQSGEFAIVKLVGPTKVAVEVPNEEERTVHVDPGDYYLLGRYGTNPKEYTYTKGDPFTVTQSGMQYSVITITLHKVISGNYKVESVSENEFETEALELHTLESNELENSSSSVFSADQELFEKVNHSQVPESINSPLTDGKKVDHLLESFQKHRDFEMRMNQINKQMEDIENMKRVFENMRKYEELGK